MMGKGFLSVMLTAAGHIGLSWMTAQSNYAVTSVLTRTTSAALVQVAPSHRSMQCRHLKTMQTGPAQENHLSGNLLRREEWIKHQKNNPMHQKNNLTFF